VNPGSGYEIDPHYQASSFFKKPCMNKNPEFTRKSKGKPYFYTVFIQDYLTGIPFGTNEV
jgi:hypothetical protein